MNCIFCSDIKKLKTTNLSYATTDKYPVTKGHTLIIPNRHVSSYFDLTDEEKKDLFNLLEEVKVHLDEQHSPDGYNIGINDGAVAGQTIMRVHIHYSPIYARDMENPRGGVRGVIPRTRVY